MTDAAREAVARAICDSDGLEGGYDALTEPARAAYCKVASAVIAAYEAAQWRPIEEAPTDGTFFLACCGKWRPFVAHFYRGTLVSDQGEDGLIAYPATHFCPIPPPPENEG
jgi:hypothetical protein